MATNFSPVLGLRGQVLNQFPSIVMFGMKGSYVGLSASGAICTGVLWNKSSKGTNI